MKAQLCELLGEPDVLRYTDIDDPSPGPGEVLVEVRAAGVNFPDGLVVSGNYQTKPALPFVPGSEAAGIIRAVGADVTGVEVGSRVLAFCGMGGYAELVTVPATMVFPIPDSMPYVDAAGFAVTYGTSYHGLVDRAELAAGETLLVLGASGGVGLTAVEIGKALGARVIAAASSVDKLALCRDHGADELIDYADEDLKTRLKEVRGGVDVVYDPVGGEHAQAAVRALAWGGRYLTVGYASGDIPKVGMNRLLVVAGSLHGVLWGAWARRNPERNAANMRQLFDWYARGALRPHVSETYPLADAPAALDVVMGRRARGKVILTSERN
ncbi:NADPH:quinone oxidoreductase family protein [Rhodococcus sp. D2-41]|uniref:NADPH:quinone oxidoreductase family protein n=1 Tax=Speluncibacter jeojiensis TaxID=2710754 RepID=A0A9X4M1W9_9ACTN|nr:NADPH:quinone oxidoreductase family protein [Rhodococcus sp. D2-41]MDG3008964.1 NADPH:quinone oxidoreductase family protein [Rhodococcus sp. D2-41]MDG3015475.1 NADPH:quinone oxidoreductase family protein [Corynebacteriales bacterium D3-21]